MIDFPVQSIVSATSRRLVVGIGELAVSDDPAASVVTHALGSCVAVCIWDPAALVGGLLHILLPDSKINPERASQQPAAFADTGIPLLFKTAYAKGLDKKRCRVKLIGGANVTSLPPSEAAVGKRNVLAARSMLWRNGVLIERELVGGHDARTVTMRIGDGVTVIGSGANAEEF